MLKFWLVYDIMLVYFFLLSPQTTLPLPPTSLRYAVQQGLLTFSLVFLEYDTVFTSAGVWFQKSIALIINDFDASAVLVGGIFRIPSVPLLVLDLISLEWMLVGFYFCKVFHIRRTEWKNPNCFTLSHPHCISRDLVSV